MSEKSSSATDKKTDGRVIKAGEFKGDLRDLPDTAPADMERPRREDPKFEPKPAPVPVVENRDN